MAKTSISYVRSRFETGDRPTGADYADLIDTLAALSTDLGTSGNNETSISGIENPTVIDTFLTTAWRMVKYTIVLTNVHSGITKTYSTELSILVDTNDVNVSEYGMIDSDGDIGTIDVSKSGTTVSLTVTPQSALRPVTVRYYRTGLKA